MTAIAVQIAQAARLFFWRPKETKGRERVSGTNEWWHVGCSVQEACQKKKKMLARKFSKQGRCQMRLIQDLVNLMKLGILHALLERSYIVRK